jgi:hypothetical protein
MYTSRPLECVGLHPWVIQLGVPRLVGNPLATCELSGFSPRRGHTIVVPGVNIHRP